MSTGFTIHCGKCGKDNAAEEFLRSPVGGDYPSGCFQCPNPECRKAFKIVQDQGRFIEVAGCDKKMWIPGRKTIVDIPAMYEGYPA
jgi:hypothetical protein